MGPSESMSDDDTHWEAEPGDTQRSLVETVERRADTVEREEQVVP